MENADLLPPPSLSLTPPPPVSLPIFDFDETLSKFTT